MFGTNVQFQLITFYTHLGDAELQQLFFFSKCLFRQMQVASVDKVVSFQRMCALRENLRWFKCGIILENFQKKVTKNNFFFSQISPRPSIFGKNGGS